MQHLRLYFAIIITSYCYPGTFVLSSNTSKISVTCNSVASFVEKSKISCLSCKKWECNCAAISVRYFCCEKVKKREREREREDTKCKVIVDIDALRSRIAKVGRARPCVRIDCFFKLPIIIIYRMPWSETYAYQC